MLSNERIKENRKQVWRLHDDKKYKECIAFCQYNINNIISNNLIDKNRDAIRSFYYMSAKCYYHLDDIETAIQMIKESLKYLGIELYTIHTYWLLAECKTRQGFNDEAVELYDKCILYYEKQMPFSEDDECLIGLTSLLSNKSILLNDIELSEYAFDTYIKQHKKELVIEFINELYENIFKIYINKNEIINAQKILKKIGKTDKKLMNKLYEKIANKALVTI